MFLVTDHLDKLTPVPGKSTPTTGEYYCPICGAENFKVDLRTGKYNGFGCSCTTTEEGKRQVRDAIAPIQWEKAVRPAQRHSYIYETVEEGVRRRVARVQRSDDGRGGRTFSQSHWNGKRWTPGLPDAVKQQIRLYRIVDGINARARGSRIFLVEGEGKVDRLLELGIPATCAIGGAGKWRKYGYPNYISDLQGYQVVLCPDRDEPGVQHCEEIEADLIQHNISVAGWLYAYPKSYLWQRLPRSGGADVADWIADGATRDEILNAVEPRRGTSPTPESDRVDESESGGPDCALRRQYRAIHQLLAERLRFNELTKEIELDNTPIDLDELQVRIAVENNLQVSDTNFQKVVTSIARESSYSPVVEYLDRVSDRYGAETGILDTLAARYLGTPHPLHNTYLRKMLIGAVARAYRPGSRFQYAVILQGRQGTKKSTFFRTLASNEWFDDSFGRASDKDERLKLHVTWFVEWAELELVFRRKDVAEVKSFLTTEFDLVRPPYGRTIQRLGRPSIIVGTTNESTFLADPTGNRRFWVIPVTRTIDIPRLEAERDRLWAAAVAAYRSGEIPDLNDEERALSHKLTDEYTTDDTWEDLIAPYVTGLACEGVTTEQILTHCLRIDAERQSIGAQRRVAGIMRQLGWEQTRRRVDGMRIRMWQRLPAQP